MIGYLKRFILRNWFLPTDLRYSPTVSFSLRGFFHQNCMCS